MTSLGVPRGANGSGANAISSLGHIAGFLTFSGSGAHGALYNGQWTDLGSYPGASSTIAYGINSSDEVVGIAFFPNQYHPFRPGKHVGVIFMNGSAVNLTTLIHGGSGFTITDAVGINDAGQILCNATTPSGSKHAVLLTPQ